MIYFFRTDEKFSAGPGPICRENAPVRLDGPDFALAGNVIMGNGTVDSPAFA